MRMGLLENGLDSIRFGLDHYRNFLSLEDKYFDKNPGYLKMAVICFHHAIEVFSKRLLSQENELLIYSDINEDLISVIKHIKDSREPEAVDLPIEWYAISDNLNIKTIDYSVCIQRLNKLFSLEESEFNNLSKLAKYRNLLIHMGIDKTIDVHEILFVLNETLNTIINFYKRELLAIIKNDYFKLEFNTVIMELQNLLQDAREIEWELWDVFFGGNFEEINNAISNLFDSEDFRNELAVYRYSTNIIYGDYAETVFQSIQFLKDDEEVLSIIPYNLRNVETTLFLDMKKNKVLFLIDHSKFHNGANNKCLYVCKSPSDFTTALQSGKFWEFDKSYFSNVFNDETIKVAFRFILDYIKSNY
ncbi:hypothetical protein [Bacillus sp. OTU2372]|uniref:hypothetical protein n=1 Tax=Bacillus sp. OTU2372 TaxID=3043858 RepID=UPI00313AB789